MTERKGGRKVEQNALHIDCRDILNNYFIQKVNQTVFQRTKVIDTYLIESIEIRDSLKPMLTKEEV